MPNPHIHSLVNCSQIRSSSSLQPQNEHQQNTVCSDTDTRHKRNNLRCVSNHHLFITNHRTRSRERKRGEGRHISTGAEQAGAGAVIAVAEKLLVAVAAAQGSGGENTGAKGGKQRADRVELVREDLEHDQRERELAQRRAYVRSLERSLCCPHLHELARRQSYRPRPVPAQSVAQRSVVLSVSDCLLPHSPRPLSHSHTLTLSTLTLTISV